jgi:glutathione peroxidase
MKATMVALFTLLSLNSFASLTIYDIKEVAGDGTEFDFSKYKGKVLLIANIASKCGFTSQLEGLQKLYADYGPKGLVVIGVPTNDFASQTPENDQDFKKFCSLSYGVNFPLLKKGSIVGKEKRALYQYLTEKMDHKFKGEVKWNFEKFIVDKNGFVVERFSSLTGPDSNSIKKIIEAQIK